MSKTKEQIYEQEAIEACLTPTAKILVYGAMQLYADQETEKLRKQISEMKSELNGCYRELIALRKINNNEW